MLSVSFALSAFSAILQSMELVTEVVTRFSGRTVRPVTVPSQGLLCVWQLWGHITFGVPFWVKRGNLAHLYETDLGPRTVRWEGDVIRSPWHGLASEASWRRARLGSPLEDRECEWEEGDYCTFKPRISMEVWKLG